MLAHRLAGPGALAALFGFSLGAAAPLLACGPDFPNDMLAGGDARMLIAPIADFKSEMVRLKLTQRFQAALPNDTFAAQATESEMADLRAALTKAKVSKEEQTRILAFHAGERTKLQKYVEAAGRWKRLERWQEREDRPDPPVMPVLVVVEGLPDEFADYFQGAIVWHNPALPDKTAARDAWERLLQRPAAERRYKSVWAAFMLAKSWEADDADKAIEYYQQVRALARKGCADSAGLAAASLGWEARLNLEQKKLKPALELYLDQLSAGDESAFESLRTAAGQALRSDPVQLQSLATNSRTRRVITAYIICCDHSYLDDAQPAPDAQNEAEPPPDKPASGSPLVQAWLEAIEAAEVKDVESAEQIALAAYQEDRMDLAQRWINRARNTPTAQWLLAKLWLRAGKNAQATALLTRVVRDFPIQPPGTNELAPAGLQDSLSAAGDPAPRRIRGELGALQLAHREYVQALDTLLNAGYWMDAAYVAERVLTLDELKSYVDRFWPPVSDEQAAEGKWHDGDVNTSPARLRSDIRYLLARRLTRSIRGDEARAYYPAEWAPQFDRLAQALRTGWEESLPAEQRARALFEAAIITRTNGMDLIGTEVEPDWHIYDGDYDQGVSVDERAITTTNGSKIVTASQDELRRGSEHKADPEERFHYRYQAAFLGWEAAKLMPNNSEETARVLCISGSWLKRRDPDTADMFYKALVRRNRRTAIGQEADRIRWFPRLDEKGAVIRFEPRPAPTPDPEPEPEPGTEPTPAPDGAAPTPIQNQVEEASTVPLQPGNYYVVHAGDSLLKIANAASTPDRPLTVRALMDANPDLDRYPRLKIGEKILIP